MNTEPSSPTPLPVIAIIRAAFQFVWGNKSRMIRALFIPAAATLVLINVPQFINWLALSVSAFFRFQVLFGWLSFLIQMLPYILFAITCHRLALIGDDSVPKYGLLTWTKRETRYLLWLVVITLICMLISYVVNSFYVSSMISEIEAGANPESFQSGMKYTYLAYIPILYIFSRLSVLYPAIALDQQINAQWAWQATARNGWRLTLIVGVLPWVLFYLVNLLLRDNATFVEYGVVRFIGFFLLAVEVVALSFSYKYLTQTEEEVTCV